MGTATTKRDIAHYFEYSNHGVEVVQDGLAEMSFGEFLVEQAALTREQLFHALQLQDRQPGVRIGECIAALGYLPYREVERFLGRWDEMDVLVV